MFFSTGKYVAMIYYLRGASVGGHTSIYQIMAVLENYELNIHNIINDLVSK